MNLISETPAERRRYDRLVRPQLYVRINGIALRTVEWSYGGLVIEDTSGLLLTGALLRIDGLIDEATYRQGQPPYSVDIRARVVRVIAERHEVALTCLKLDDAAYQILSAIENRAHPVLASQA